MRRPGSIPPSDVQPDPVSRRKRNRTGYALLGHHSIVKIQRPLGILSLRCKKQTQNSIPWNTIVRMFTIFTTHAFDAWFCSLKDKQTQRRIQARIDRAEDGNLVTNHFSLDRFCEEFNE